MSRQAARKIIDLMVKQSAEQDALLLQIQSMCTEAEYRRLKSMIGQSMGSMLLDVINPIVELHPDPRPPELEQDDRLRR